MKNKIASVSLVIASELQQLSVNRSLMLIRRSALTSLLLSLITVYSGFAAQAVADSEVTAPGISQDNSASPISSFPAPVPSQEPSLGSRIVRSVVSLVAVCSLAVLVIRFAKSSLLKMEARKQASFRSKDGNADGETIPSSNQLQSQANSNGPKLLSREKLNNDCELLTFAVPSGEFLLFSLEGNSLKFQCALTAQGTLQATINQVNNPPTESNFAAELGVEIVKAKAVNLR